MRERERDQLTSQLTAARGNADIHEEDVPEGQ